MTFTNEQVADAIKAVSQHYFTNRFVNKKQKATLTNRALDRLFQNLVRDVLAGKPEGTTFCTMAQLARDFNSVTSSMNQIPQRLTERLSETATTLIDGVSLEFTFTGPRERGSSEDAPIRKNERLYLSASYRILPDTASVLPAARHVSADSPSGVIHVLRRRSLIRRKSRTVLAVLLLLTIASIPTILILRQRQEAAETRERNRMEAKRLLDEAYDALGGNPGTRYVEDPPGFDRTRSALFEIARRKIQQASELTPEGNSRAANLMGIYYLLTGDLNNAEIHYQQAILLDSSNEEALCNLGDIYLMQGKPEPALRYYARALQISPNYPPAYFDQAAALYWRYIHWRRLLPTPDKRLFDPNVFAFEQMLDEQDERIYQDVANRRRVLDEAEAAARRAVQLEPQTASPYRVLGNILHSRGNFAAATEAYSNALRLQPDDAYSHYDYGVELDGAHDYTAAVAQLVQAIRLNHNYTKAFAALSFALHNAGKEDLAVAALLETNRLAPNDESFSWLRKRVLATPDLVANINGRAHAFEDDYGKFLLHELSP